MTAIRGLFALLLVACLGACNMVFAIPDRELDESCGRAGNACCPGYRCKPDAVCNGTVCVEVAGACNHDADCAKGEKCGGPTGCGPTACPKCTTQVGSKAIGDACVNGIDCASGYCDGDRRCSISCVTDADCAAAFGKDGVCYESGILDKSGKPVNRFGVCAKRCGRDGDCTVSTDGCVGFPNQAENRIDLVCRPPRGAGKVGDPCKSGDDCRSNLCNLGKQVCSTLCRTDADCSGALPRCSTSIFPLPRDDAKATITVCLP